MANINAVFPSKYLKAAELNGRTYKLVIDVFAMEDIGDGERKPVLYFRGAQKGLVLNKTNAMSIAMAYGEETDHWIGKEIEIHPDTTMFNGRPTPCLRVKPIYPQAGAPLGQRQPAPEIPQPGRVEDGLDDSIPF